MFILYVYICVYNILYMIIYIYIYIIRRARGQVQAAPDVLLPRTYHFCEHANLPHDVTRNGMVCSIISHSPNYTGLSHENLGFWEGSCEEKENENGTNNFFQLLDITPLQDSARLLPSRGGHPRTGHLCGRGASGFAVVLLYVFIGCG